MTERVSPEVMEAIHDHFPPDVLARLWCSSDGVTRLWPARLMNAQEEREYFRSYLEESLA